jgi:mono/diheme cytochrome c family protein
LQAHLRRSDEAMTTTRIDTRDSDAARTRASRWRALLGAAALSSASGAIAGCASRAATPPRTIVAAPRATPPVVAARPAAQPSVAEPRATIDPQGSALFFRVCGPCHVAMWRVPPGGTLGGNGMTEAALRRQIREGSTGARGTMPAIDERALPEPSMLVLLDYLRSLGVAALQ